MTRIGMIGGFGPESTLEYYRLLIDGYRVRKNSIDTPEILLYSMSVQKLFALVDTKKWQELTDWLLEGIAVLHKGGADIGFISANTPHVVFSRLQAASPIPLISIVDAACEHLKACGIKRAGLMGTSFTMQNDFYQQRCAPDQMMLVLPSGAEQDYIQDKLMTEIEQGIFLDETRAGLLKVIKNMIDENGVEGVILGCTELPLILPQTSQFGIPLFNTTQIHVDKILDTLLVLESKTGPLLSK